MTGAIAQAGPLARRDLIAVLASTAYAGPLADEVNRNLDDFANRLGQRGATAEGLLWREFPLSADARATGGDHWQIRIWSVAVLTVPASSVPRQLFRTTTLDLVWEAGDWKVDRWDTGVGPTPAPPAEVAVSSGDAVAGAAAWPAIGGGS